MLPFLFIFGQIESIHQSEARRNLNIVDGHFADIAGGLDNIALGDYSTVLGGKNNEANGFGSAVLGGSNNIANGYFSIVGGYGASAEHNQSVVIGLEETDTCSSNGPHSFTICASGGLYINDLELLTEINRLNTTVSQLTSSENGGLEDIVTTNTADIDINADTIVDNAGDIVTNAGDIVTNAGYIETNAGDIVTNAGDIVTNAGDIVTNAGDIVTNAGDIVTNAVNIAINTANIETNVEDIITNAANIETNAEFIQVILLLLNTSNDESNIMTNNTTYIQYSPINNYTEVETDDTYIWFIVVPLAIVVAAGIISIPLYIQKKRNKIYNRKSSQSEHHESSSESSSEPSSEPSSEHHESSSTSS